MNTDDHVPVTPKTVQDCQHDAVVLHGILEGIDLIEDAFDMGNPRRFGNARCALVMVALERARQLADDLDAAETAARRAR